MKIPQYNRQADINPANLPMADPQSMTQEYGAARKFGAEVTEFGVSENRQMVIRQQEILKENEEAIAQTHLHGFKLAGIEALKNASQVQGEAAVGTEGKPGITTTYRAQREAEKQKALESFTGSEKTRNALAHALDGVVSSELSQVAHHEASQGLVLKKQAIETVYDDSLRMIQAGGDLERSVGLINQAVDAYSGGSPQEKLLYRAKLELAFQKTAKDRLITDTTVRLKNEFPDIQKRIEHIESPDFIKSLGPEGAEISNTLMSYTLREWKAQEDAYKGFADKKVGELSEKIYTHTPYTPEELAGLRPPERALIEKIRDYQLRQDRAEVNETARMEAAKRAEKSAERQEARYARQEAKIAAQEKSDSIAGQIVAKIIQNEPLNVRDDIYARIPDGLDTNKANQLVGMAGKLADPGYKLGLEVLKQAIPDKAEYGRAVLDFQKQVEDAKAQGEKIVSIAESIAKPKKKGKVAEWLDGVWKDVTTPAPWTQGDTKPTGPSQEDLEFTAKKRGITVDEVKKRMGIQ